MKDSELLSFENENFVISQPLSQLMLNWNDVFGSDDGSYAYKEVYYGFIFNHQTTVVDVSSELSSTCLTECTKQVWVTEQEEVDGLGGGKAILGRRVTIFMFRSSDSQRAKKTAENFFNGTPILHDLKIYEYHNDVNAPAENIYFGEGIINHRFNIIIATSIGPISIGVISRINTDDTSTDGDIASYFLNKQIKKIQDAGVVIHQ